MKNQIHFLSFGKGKKTLVFLHGWQQNGKCFATLVPHLYKKYKTYLVDMPGFGNSFYKPDLKNSYDYAEFITQWLKKEGVKNIILIGHSFGGKVATIVAVTNPDLIKGLVLISAAGIPHPKFYYPLLPFLRKIPLAEHLKKFLISRDYKKAGRLLPVFKEIVKENLRKDFAKIEVPTLIIWGDKDDELPVNDAYLIKRLIENSSIKIIKNADHFPFIEKPQKIASLIDKFAERI